jgi:hypothetical protein
MERKGRKRVCRGCICTSFHLLHDRAFWIWVGRDEEYRRIHTCTPEYWVTGVVVYSSSCRVCNAIRKQQLGRCIPYPEDSCGNHADTHTHTQSNNPKKSFSSIITLCTLMKLLSIPNGCASGRCGWAGNRQVGEGSRSTYSPLLLFIFFFSWNEIQTLFLFRI